MRFLRAFLLLWWLLAFSAAAEIGTVTVASGSARLLRGVTWYPLVPGARVEEADIIDAADTAQVQLEFEAGTIANLVGPGALYLAAAPAVKITNSGPLAATLTGGWFKVSAKSPGV